jgi:N utilization substance protein A
MSASIPQSIDALCKEHGIDRDLVIEAMKEAVRAAARKQFKSGEEIQVEWTAEAGLELFASKVVVEEVTNPGKELSLDEAREMAGDEVEVGDELQLPMPMEEMGRIAAQTAKQILFQKVRDAVRANVYEQYIDKVGDLVNGYVKRFERGDLIVDLGNVEAILPRQQQSRGEQWAQGERIRVVIEDVSKEAKGPQVVVSRTSPELLRRLFEMEVPEIYDETVVIKSAVREPGERAKIAVASNERDVDPVGACVGMKGSRVQAIIRELRGEKIDIIEWSDEPSVFAANALSPAKVNQVRITDIERRQMEVIVNEDQLSLAIGKRGQNVRLATKLVGWNIDIRSEEEIKKEVAAQMGALIASGGTVPLDALEGITAATTAALAEHGINDIDTLAATSIDDLVDHLDISLDEAESILSSAQAVVGARSRPRRTKMKLRRRMMERVLKGRPQSKRLASRRRRMRMQRMQPKWGRSVRLIRLAQAHRWMRLRESEARGRPWSSMRFQSKPTRRSMAKTCVLPMLRPTRVMTKRSRRVRRFAPRTTFSRESRLTKWR